MDLRQLDVFHFVRKFTEGFDASHDYNHAIRVYETALDIAAHYNINDDDSTNIIKYAALMHDLLDHKYTNKVGLFVDAEGKQLQGTLNRGKMLVYLVSKLGAKSAATVVDIIDNVSYSKEVAGKIDFDQLQRDGILTLRNIVSDADKIDALGERGLKRCIEYARSIGGEIPADVVTHCEEKLLKLRDEYIRTAYGKSLAKSGHEVIKRYVEKHTQ